MDSAFLQYLISKTLAKSASVHLLFAFEYVIQARSSTPVSIIKCNLREALLPIPKDGVTLIGGMVGIPQLCFKCARCHTYFLNTASCVMPVLLPNFSHDAP